jgi:hypothetical protein
MQNTVLQQLWNLFRINLICILNSSYYAVDQSFKNIDQTHH